MDLQADLRGKTAFVTGASSGLGAHFAKVLARAGAHVVVSARRAERLDELITDLKTYGTKASSVVMDVTDPVAIGAAVASLEGIDILVNNAGVSNSKSLFDQTIDDWEFILNTNLKGAYLVGVEVARSMRERGHGGSIINIASILGLRQGGHVTPYAISKAAVVQLTKQLALELARFDIRVNALAPGYVVTDLNRDFFKSDAGKAMIKRIPVRRLGELEDLSGPLLLLASDASRYMTGTVLVADGGHLVSEL